MMITWCIGIVIESKFFFSIRSMSVKPKLALQDEDAANFVTSVVEGSKLGSYIIFVF